MSTNEIIRRRALRSSGAAIDWESLYRIIVEGGSTELIIPEGITAIRQSAFQSRTWITKVVLPDTIAPFSGGSTSNSAFRGCRSINEVELGNGINRIPESMFRECTSLTSIVIPPQVTYLHAWCFTSSGLTEMIIERQDGIVSNGYRDIIPSSCIVYVPDDLVADYQAANNWNAFPDRIKGISERPVGGVILNQFNGGHAAERVAA